MGGGGLDLHNNDALVLENPRQFTLTEIVFTDTYDMNEVYVKCYMCTYSTIIHTSIVK